MNQPLSLSGLCLLCKTGPWIKDLASSSITEGPQVCISRFQKVTQLVHSNTFASEEIRWSSEILNLQLLIILADFNSCYFLNSFWNTYFFFSCTFPPFLRRKTKEKNKGIYILFFPHQHCFGFFSWLKQASGHFLARMNAFVSLHRFTGTWCWGNRWRPELQYNAHSHRRLAGQLQQPASLSWPQVNQGQTKSQENRIGKFDKINLDF